MPNIKKILKNFPRRKKTSHKGENGKILIIGGSEKIHGAPLLNFLGIKSIGFDLCEILVPKNNIEITKNFSPEIFVDNFKKNFLTSKDLSTIIKKSENYDACVLGSGLEKNLETKMAVIEILDKIKIPVVIDADAIFEFSDYKKIPKNSVFTPHQKEFERLNVPKNFDFVVVKKGKIDVITQKNLIHKNNYGSPILTHGGTGDFLAGMIGTLIAKKIDSFEAAKISTFLLGFASEIFEEKYGENLDFVKITKMISILLSKNK